MHLHILEDRDAEALQEPDEGVVLIAIQIAVDSDLSAEQRRLLVQHTYNPETSPPS